MSLRSGRSGSYSMPAISDSRMPVALNNSMIAWSRLSTNVLPRHVFDSEDSSSAVNTGTIFTPTLGGFSRAIGLGCSSSSAYHLKNCCSARNWLLA